MKKVLRVIAFVMVLVLMSTSLCGCRMLDELRANHAVFTSDDTILWNGVEYKALPESVAMCPQSDFSQQLFVTDADVPTLLSMFFGNECHVCNDGMILECYDSSLAEFMSAESDYMTSSSVYYCQLEDYDRVKENIEKEWSGTLVYDTYSYSFSEYDESTEWYETRTRILTASQADVFETAVSSAVVAEGAYDWQMEFITDVSLSTDDLLFYGAGTYGVYSFTVSTTGTTYFVWDYAREDFFAVDKSYTEAFAEMFAPAITAMEEAEWDEDGYELVF